MKKVFIIIAIALTAAGIALFVGALASSGFDFSKFGASKYETNTYTAGDEFSKIEIDTSETDITFKPSEDGKFSVVCVEREKVKHTVTVTDKTLKIGEEDNRKWFDHISFFSKHASMTVYLPAERYESLDIRSATGDVSIPSPFSFGEINITQSTGDTECSASAEGTLTIKKSTGKIRLDKVRTNDMSLSSSTGRINIDSAECAGNVSIRVSTGKATVTDLHCKILESNGSTGDLTLKNVTASESMTLERSTGDVRFENCDAGQITVKTSTGSIKGTLLSEKIFTAETSTGRISVPESSSGGKCRLKTSTGSIEIKLSTD